MIGLSVSGVMGGKHDILQVFPDVFSGDIGTLPGSVRLTLKPDAEPVLRPPKRLPIELQDQVKVTVYLRGCPSQKKIFVRCHKCNNHKLYINTKLMKCTIR